MKSKRGAGIMMGSDYKPKSLLRLEGEHAEQAVEHPIGRKVKLTVHAIKTSHNKNMDGTHSAAYDVSKVEEEDNEKEDKAAEGKDRKALGGSAYSKQSKIKD